MTNGTTATASTTRAQADPSRTPHPEAAPARGTSPEPTAPGPQPTAAGARRAEAGTGSVGPTAEPLRNRPARGRHRRPRPRRMLFAVGGLALAAGALSLVRMAPDSVVGGGGNAEAKSSAGVLTDEAVDTEPSVWAVPSARPASSDGTTAPPTAGVSLVPAGTTSPAGPVGSAGPVPRTTPPAAIPSARAGAPDTTTGIPTAPVPSQPVPPPAASTPAQQPPPTPTPPPSGTTDTPGLCVPIVGICVNDLTGPAGPR
ncbi:hypothetical protein [Streptomyces sp. SD15]